MLRRTDPDLTARLLEDVLVELDTEAPGIVVRGADGLRLVAGIRVDAQQLTEAAADARHLVHTDRRRAVLAARSAIALYDGDLLPDDHAQPWTVEPRIRLRRDYLAAEDLLIEVGIADGDLDDAIVAAQRAVQVDPTDEDRHVQLAELYLRQGRRSRATRALEDARAAAGALGVATSLRYRRALRGLHLHADEAAPVSGSP
jgi:DNA-binding SARP family transcriptional activator